jgi:hypothetical protein
MTASDRARWRPALLVCGAVLLLIVWTSLPIEGQFGGLRLKRIDLLSDVRVRPAAAAPSVRLPEPAVAEFVGPLRPSPRPGASIVPADAPGEGEAGGQPVELFADGALDRFNEALTALAVSGEPLRIAYFGDSIIEGDLITGDLRQRLQVAYGGSGTGFLPITSEVAQYRSTVKHTFSPNWRVVSLTARDSSIPLGISGSTWLPNCPAGDASSRCSAWVEYGVPPGHHQTLSEIRTVRVFYSHAPAGATVESVFDKTSPQTVDLTPGDEIQEAVMRSNDPAKSVRLTFSTPKGLRVYGAAWDGDGGVTVDNFGYRGQSGIALAWLSDAMLRRFDTLRHYNLIVLQYGVNVTAPDQTDFSWYRAGMDKSLAHLQFTFPSTAVLSIGVSDRSYKPGAEYETMPSVALVLEGQRNAARKAGIAFWDLQAAMGGYNSMVQWVTHEPALAALDYTHFSPAGSQRVAAGLFRALMAEYRKRGVHGH